MESPESGPEANSPFIDLQEFPAGLEEWAARACDEVERNALGDLIVSRCLRVFDAKVADKQFSDYLRMSVLENLDILVRLLTGEIDPSRLQLEQPLSFSSIQAQLQVPQADLQRSYRVSFATIWEQMTGAVELAGRTHGIPAERIAEAVAVLTRAIFSYHDYVTSQAAANYTRVEATLGQSRARLRQQLIQEMLREGADSLAPSDLVLLDLEIGGDHVAIILPEASLEAGERLVRHCRADGIAGHGLVHPRGLGSAAVWLTRHHSWDEAGISAVHRMLVREGFSAAMGDPHRDLDGFIASYREAEEALLLLESRSVDEIPVVVRYSTVMLDLLLVRDPLRAGEYVSKVLGPLAGAGPEAARLCDTLEAWLRSGSHVAAAEVLGVHEQTIRNRLTRAETLIGSGLRSRRTEVEVALRLRRLLDPHRFEGPEER